MTWPSSEVPAPQATIGQPCALQVRATLRHLRSSIRQQSHLTLTEGEYARAVAALREAGAEEDGFYRP